MAKEDDAQKTMLKFPIKTHTHKTMPTKKKKHLNLVL